MGGWREEPGFYDENGRIAGRDHKWFQYALTVTVEMICRMGLDTKLERTKVVVYNPGFIWGKWGEQVYKRQVMGEGERFR